jgi:hypothetical protein
MLKKNANGSYTQTHSISMNNPQAKQDSDWFDELCKKHDTKNHWKKKPKNKNEKEN